MRFFRLVECDPETVRKRLINEPRRFWQPAVESRVLPSVAGSNVYIDVRTHPLWWAAAVLFVLAALTAREAEATAIFLLFVTVAWITAGVLQARSKALAAIAEDPGEPLYASLFVALLIGAAAVAAMLVIAHFRYDVASREVAHYTPPATARHEAPPQSGSDEFPPGTPRAAVIAELGEPDTETRTEDLDQHSSRLPVRTACVNKAATQLNWFDENGPGFTSVYLDDSDRVVCVEHGNRSESDTE